VDTDEGLLAAWRGGDAKAGRALFARHVDGVTRFFFSKVQSGVEDLVQRTFLALIERSADIPAGVGVRPYLFGIARKLLLRRFRDEYRSPIDAGTVSVADLQTSPSAVVDQRRHLLLLYRGLQALPVDLQIALELFYWESLTAAEIGAVQGVPEGTVRSRLRRGRELLAAQMQALPAAASEEEIERWARELRDRVGR
jgi:RNA polymerase sigma factor (sigma-70 family)